jgi:hypothetical protein
VNASDEDMERMLLRYFVNDEWAARGAQPLDAIFEQIARPSGWRDAFFENLETEDEKGALSAILERMASDGLIEGRRDHAGGQTHYEAKSDYQQSERYKHLYDLSVLDARPYRGEIDPIEDYTERELQIAVDSTDWTGLSKAVGPVNLAIIRERTTALQLAIMQSEADIQLKTDACKRVEAVMILLEAPNVPWREVVSLLNHPTVTTFFAAASIIQFIIELAA